MTSSSSTDTIETRNTISPPSISPRCGFAMQLGLDNMDPSSIDSTISTSDHTVFPAPHLPDFSTSFEDLFSFSALLSDATPVASDQDPISASNNPNEKLLGFSRPTFAGTLLKSTGHTVDVSAMTAELRGMFFVAEDVFEGENHGRPLELTCYRRNLWQCLCELTLPRDITHVADNQGKAARLSELAISLTATESMDGETAEILAFPWKTSGRAAKSTPATYPLDLTVGQQDDPGQVTMKVAWKKLQFKNATANNGRRSGLQQCYTVKVNLVAKTITEESVKVAEIRSSPVIVRGRNPGNFSSSKEVPVTTGKRKERKGSAVISTNSKCRNAQPNNATQEDEFDTNSWVEDFSPEQLARVQSPVSFPNKRQAVPQIKSPAPPFSTETSRTNRRRIGSVRSPMEPEVSKPVDLSIFGNSDGETSPVRMASSPESPQTYMGMTEAELSPMSVKVQIPFMNIFPSVWMIGCRQ